MRLVSSVALAALLASSVSVVHAQQAAAPAAAQPAAAQPVVKQDTVLASVDGSKITQLDLEIAFSSLSDSAKQQLQTNGFGPLLDELIKAKALENEARKEKLDQDPQVKAQINVATGTVLQNALLKKDISPLVTDDKLKAIYQDKYASKPGEPEIHAEHILLKTQADAQAVIDQLGKGANFEDLAKSKSTDPNASNGGDLGWFKKGDMVPAFSDAAFALQKGQYSKAPVQSPYGWHVIKVLDTRVSTPQTYEQVHDQLAQAAEQAAINAELTKLVAGSKILVLDTKGKLVTEKQAEDEAKAAQAAAPAAPAGK